MKALGSGGPAVTIDRKRYLVMVGLKKPHLTPGEFDLLVIIADGKGEVMSRERIFALWGLELAKDVRAVDQGVARLRAKLGKGVIRTVQGRGYGFAAPLLEAETPAPAGKAGR